jgi:hypothetical protein
MGAIRYIDSWTLVHSRDVCTILWLAGVADAIQGHLENVSRVAAYFAVLGWKRQAGLAC